MSCCVCTPTKETSHKMPGHWLLAKMGKRVLRPGGLELTRKMLEGLNIQKNDSVVEFAPGLGVTARMTLERNPASYTAVERDENAAAKVSSYLTGENQECLLGTAEKSGLDDESSTAVYGEAMLTMHGDEQKRRIVAEAFRLLKPGGRYGIHELSLTPDDLPESIQEEINREMSRVIHIGARPLTAKEWRGLLEDVGFQIKSVETAPMHLLEKRRIIQDEGLIRALRFMFNVIRTPEARKRVTSMRQLFRKHKKNLNSIAVVAVKPTS